MEDAGSWREDQYLEIERHSRLFCDITKFVGGGGGGGWRRGESSHVHNKVWISKNFWGGCAKVITALYII